MTLRVDRHPRGHVAPCNGDIGLVGASVVQCSEENSSWTASQVQKWGERELEKKAQRLIQFQRSVKDRVNTRERLVQRKMATVSGKDIGSEPTAAERAVQLHIGKVN